MHARPTRHCVSWFLVCVCFWLCADASHAQVGGGTGGGTTGGGTTGGGTAAGGNDGTIGTGQIGDGGNLAQPEFLTFGADIDPTGGTGFAGRGDASQNFVGGGLLDAQGQAGAGRGGQNQFQQLNRTQGQLQQGRGTQPTGPSRSERVRARHRVAFAYSPRPRSELTTRLQSRFRSLATRQPEASGVQVSFDDRGNATLTGTVASADRARFVEALARLEPGVRRVDNQLQVGSPE